MLLPEVASTSYEGYAFQSSIKPMCSLLSCALERLVGRKQKQHAMDVEYNI